MNLKLYMKLKGSNHPHTEGHIAALKKTSFREEHQMTLEVLLADPQFKES